MFFKGTFLLLSKMFLIKISEPVKTTPDFPFDKVLVSITAIITWGSIFSAILTDALTNIFSGMSGAIDKFVM